MDFYWPRHWFFIYVLAPDVLFGGALNSRAVAPLRHFFLSLACRPDLRTCPQPTDSGRCFSDCKIWTCSQSASIQNFHEYFREYVSAGEFIDPHTNLLPVSFTYYWPSRDFDWFTSTAPNPLVRVSGYIAATKTLVDLANYRSQKVSKYIVKQQPGTSQPCFVLNSIRTNTWGLKKIH